MGGSVAVEARDKHLPELFVDDKLLKGELIMKRNSSARQNFVEYIKSGAWTEQLSHFEDFLLTRTPNNTYVWSKFGYKSPMASSPTRRFLSSASRTMSDHSSEFSAGFDTDSSAGSAYSKMVLEEFYSTISNSVLFKTEELRSVLLAALLPIYMNSPEYAQSKSNSDWLMRSNTANTLPIEPLPSDLKALHRKRSERLQDWLLGAAAMSDSSQLEEYLSDPYSSWVDDYKKILKNLPVTVYVCQVDTKKQESHVVFSSHGKKLGAHLHEIFSARCSPHDAELVQRAVFGAKSHKLCVASYGGCSLRALKPVPCVHHQNQHLKCMIGIESYSFVSSGNPDAPSASVSEEQPFQQIEDLLTLLPVLIKLDKTPL